MNLTQLKSQLTQLKPELYERFGVNELGVFGSFVRHEERPDSDIDVLVSFDPERKVTLFTLMDLQEFLTETFGRKADIAIKKSLKPFIGKQILSEVEYV
jgi:predicted nucleotidyltransferase